MSYRFKRPDVRQEEDALPWQKILLIALATILIMVALIIWSWDILRGRLAMLDPSGRFPDAHLGPRREVSGVQQRIFPEQGNFGEVGRGQILNAQKQKELSSFGWVNKDQGLVSIPIDDAMSLVASEEEHR